jgi:hypothetical protein
MTLSGYNPLSSINIHATSISPTGLIVVVGPNCSGKTQLLRDIQRTLLADGSSLVVAKTIRVCLPPNGEQFVRDLIQEGYARSQPNNPENIELCAPFRGTGSPTGKKFHVNHAPALCNQFTEQSKDELGIARGFFGDFGQVLLASLFAANRLTSFIDTSAFDTELGIPQNDLQALYNDPEAKRELAAETGRVFGNAAWLDNTRGDGRWRIKVSRTSELPPVADRLEASRVRAYDSIDIEGDGYKSYVAIVISLILGRRPVCLIDEPELHLHPPQAYSLGQFIGRHGRSKQQATFVATHSSHVLRGILSTGKDDITVIRLTRVGKTFSAHYLDNAELRGATENPRSRAETILDGVFGQAVAIVEAEGDRVVYQAAMEGVEAQIQELRFVPVHGTGGINRILKFYQSLKVPVAVIPDCDFIGKSGELNPIIEELATGEERGELTRLATETMNDIIRIPPAIAEDQAKQELLRIADSIKSWTVQDDADGRHETDDMRVRRELEKVRAQLYRLRRLKDEGVEGYRPWPEIHRKLTRLVERCKRIGLFLVHVGDLENWVRELMTDVGKTDKGTWADTASQRIRDCTSKSGDVWEFMKEVVGYLNEQRRRLGV